MIERVAHSVLPMACCCLVMKTSFVISHGGHSGVWNCNLQIDPTSTCDSYNWDSTYGEGTLVMGAQGDARLQPQQGKTLRLHQLWFLLTINLNSLSCNIRDLQQRRIQSIPFNARFIACSTTSPNIRSFWNVRAGRQQCPSSLHHAYWWRLG